MTESSCLEFDFTIVDEGGSRYYDGNDEDEVNGDNLGLSSRPPPQKKN